MRKGVFVLPLLLAGCGLTSGEFFPSSVSYHAVYARVYNQDQKGKDEKECHALADNYSPGLKTGAIAQAAIEGGSNNLAYAPINVAVPLAGAAGGAASSALVGIGVNGQQTIKIYMRCLEKLSREDKAFIIADPNE